MKQFLAPFFTIFVLVLTFQVAFGQSPQMFSYQGVARDNSGNVLANQSIGLKIEIHQGSSNGTVVYAETHNPSTNQFGLFR